MPLHGARAEEEPGTDVRIRLGLTAVPIPGQTITTSSQADAVAICGKVG
jgi:hypothetical protein